MIRRIPNLNLHTPSWLSVYEIKLSLEHHDLNLSKQNISFQALVTLMEFIDSKTKPGSCRFVFWFDN